MDINTSRETAIKELKLIIKKSSDLKEVPHAIGGTFNLSPQEMLREVENNTEVGQQIIKAFGRLRKQFPTME
ncbi:MAG: hypothetical protein WC231_07680 [Dehalococcoidales bacterium]|jgi:hypothetical protein|nr:hypothetical protein [Dehalococcoidales bacterium]MDX9986787.1 hypothetical protein [Dehalococcoidales bacterium]